MISYRKKESFGQYSGLVIAGNGIAATSVILTENIYFFLLHVYFLSRKRLENPLINQIVVHVQAFYNHFYVAKGEFEINGNGN